MKFNVDNFFYIGDTHHRSGKPCQDYSSSYVAPSGTYAVAIISDGCSSGNRTDIGSRIITLATLEAIKNILSGTGEFTESDFEGVYITQKERISASKDLLGLKSDDLYATCISAVISEHSGIIYIQGDGVYAIKFFDGSIFIGKIEWSYNMPFYPAYMENELGLFIANQSGGAKHTIIQTDSNNIFGFASESSVQTEDGIRGVKISLSEDELKQIEYVAVFSDGVSQISNVELGDAVKEFLAYKTTAGEFCKRRINALLRKMRESGNVPNDDIACSVIHIQKEEVN